MTEREWLNTTDPEKMFYMVILAQPTHRKLALFLATCFRNLASICPADTISIMERYIDGFATLEEFLATRNHLEYWRNYLPRHSGFQPLIMSLCQFFRHGVQAPRHCNFSVFNNISAAAAMIYAQKIHFPVRSPKEISISFAEERSVQCQFLRCMFGNPFKLKCILLESWLSWNNGTVPKLAQTIYEDRRFDLMPILADALEEAGCDDFEMLTHCRDANHHTRGCWVTDVLLGKK